MKGVYIQELSCVSALGVTEAEAEKHYLHPAMLSVWKDGQPVFPLAASAQQALDALLSEYGWLQRHSRTVQLAVLAASALQPAKDIKTLVNIGSSRGSSDLWEHFHAAQLASQRLSPAASPYTTPGNIASSVGRYLAADSVALDHSITCGSGLQAIANAIAWIRAGMCSQAVAGGAEAPLTPFTQAQFRSLGIVSREADTFLCKPLWPHKTQNTLCLGEGAGIALLSAQVSEFRIAGVGFGTEQASSLSGITPGGEALQQSMREALADAGIGAPDLVVAHAPGTRKGDAAEVFAIQTVTGSEVPVLSTKHLSGHALGASGMLSMQLALLVLKGLRPAMPYETDFTAAQPQNIKNVLVNATGFGGNAISLLICRE